MVPNDPFILLSYVNTQLRDFYQSLDEMCNNLNLEKKIITKKLEGIDYFYDPVTNQFT